MNNYWDKHIVVAERFSTWLTGRIYHAHDKAIKKEFRAFEKKYGPNGTFNFGNYVRATPKLMKAILAHPKMPEDLKVALRKHKRGDWGWLA